LGERLSEEACAGRPQAGFCEGEAYNGARLNLVVLSIPKGESNGEYKASLNIGGVLPTRQTKPIITESVAITLYLGEKYPESNLGTGTK